MRNENWPDALHDVIEAHKESPFEWGKSDCIRFPLDCVTAMTGDDFAEALGEYDSLLSAYRRLNSFGFENVGDAFAEHFEEIAPAFMGRGDLATILNGDTVSGAVCIGSKIIGKSMDGLIVVDRYLANRAFKVE